MPGGPYGRFSISRPERMYFAPWNQRREFTECAFDENSIPSHLLPPCGIFPFDRLRARCAGLRCHWTGSADVERSRRGRCLLVPLLDPGPLLILQPGV